MNRCEHGQKVTKFCVTEHCHHKEAAGCDYCMKRYHFHLTNTLLLSQTNIEDIIKKLTLPSDSKYKTRILQEAAIDYIRNLKSSLNNWLDQAQNAIADRLSHPLLRKQGLLPTYNRLKYREYRKINAKDLRSLNEFAKSSPTQDLKKSEVAGYFEEVEWTSNMLSSVEKLANELIKLPEVKEGDGAVGVPSKAKANDVLESIGRQMAKRKSQQKSVLASVASSKTDSIKFQESTLMKRRVGDPERKHTHNHNNSFLIDESKRQSIQGGGEEAGDALSNIPHETDKVEREKRLKRRRSSIDDKFDLKFGSQVEEKAQEFQDRKKKVIDKKTTEKGEKKEEDSIIGNLLSLKFAKRQEARKQEEGSEKGLRQEIEGNEGGKLNQGMGLMQNLIDNILPPLPDPVKKDDSPINQKVVKIPVTMKEQPIDEIQSPIWKKRKESNNNSAGGGFGIHLNSTFNDKPDNKSSAPKDAVSITSQPAKKEEDQPIFLQRNEKNSLLLFSEALKCQSHRAIELLKASLKYSPNNLSAAEYLSYLYLEGGRAKECLQVCQSILLHLEDTPEQFELTLHLHNNRAAALNMLGRYSESIMVLEKCLRSRRKHYFYKNLADAYFSLGIPEKASMNYEKAVKLDPEYDEAFYNLAVTQFMQEEYTSALLNIREAVRIDSTNENYTELEREVINRKENIMM